MGDISIKGRSPLVKGGRVGFKHGSPTKVPELVKKYFKRHHDVFAGLGGGQEGKPHSTYVGRVAAGKRRISRYIDRKAKLKNKDKE